MCLGTFVQFWRYLFPNRSFWRLERLVVVEPDSYRFQVKPYRLQRSGRLVFAQFVIGFEWFVLLMLIAYVNMIT